MHRSSLLIAAFMLALAPHAPALGADGSAAAPRPNVVVLLADDLGYGDVGCFGHPHIATSHIDRLASQGMKLTACYAAAPMCSPSRAGLLTGRSPHRTGIFDWIAHDNESPVHLRESEITLATILRKAGYGTALHGKWHLNGSFNTDAQPQPDDHGFDYWFATQFSPSHRDPAGFVRNGKSLPAQSGYACQVVVDDAIGWLRTGRDRARPFFQFISFHEPHHPVRSPPELVERYIGVADKGRDQAVYFANVHNLDLAVGRYLAALDALGLSDRTLVVFTSDHGPQTRRPDSVFARSYGSSGPFRGRKRSLWEGGVRVPGIVRWPGRIEPGSESDTPIGFVDLLPTVCAVAGADVPQDRVIDGANALPVLERRRFERRVPLHWHFYAPLSGPQSSLRWGPWVLTAEWSSGIEPFKKGARHIPSFEGRIAASKLVRFRLYHVLNDPHQDRDVASDHTDVVARLKPKLIELHRSARDESPRWATTGEDRQP